MGVKLANGHMLERPVFLCMINQSKIAIHCQCRPVPLKALHVPQEDKQDIHT